MDHTDSPREMRSLFNWDQIDQRNYKNERNYRNQIDQIAAVGI